MSDVVFLNSTLFLITMPHGMKFVTVDNIPTYMDKKLSKYLKRVMTIYSISGMMVHNVLMDMYFDNTIDELMENFIVNTSASK